MPCTNREASHRHSGKAGEQPRSHFVSAWRIRGAPAAWDEDDVVNVLEGAGFSNIQVIFTAEHRKPWMIKANLDKDDCEPLLAVEAAGRVLQAERVRGRRDASIWKDQAWAPPKASHKGKGKGDKGKQALADAAGRPSEAPPTATPIDLEPDGEGGDKPKEGEAKPPARERSQPYAAAETHTSRSQRRLGRA